MAKPDKVITKAYESLVALNKKRAAIEKRAVIFGVFIDTCIILIILAKYALMGLGLYYFIKFIISNPNIL
jgi:hypothetical protein